ncbi:MAG: MFS transporter, partial [Chloroflexota bacterium]|nr:MFS transporter [Chloroflexota bacterium]
FVAALPSNTFVAIFLVRERGLDPALVGVALTLHSLVRAIVSPAVGALSDRYGRRAVLLACTSSSAVCAPGFLLIHDPLTLFAWHVLFGLTAAPFFPVGISLLLDLAPVRHQQTLMALNTSALNVGYTLAIVPTGFLAERGYGWLGLQSRCSPRAAPEAPTRVRGPWSPGSASACRSRSLGLRAGPQAGQRPGLFSGP